MRHPGKDTKMYHESRHQPMEQAIVIFSSSCEHKKVITCFRSLSRSPNVSVQKMSRYEGKSTFSQKSSKLRLPPPRLVTTRTYARRLPTSFSLPLPFGGFERSSNISSS